MRNTKTQVMTTIAAIIRKYKKKYCVASQGKMLELLYSFYKKEIKVRQLNVHLADLRKMGYIKSIRRTHRNADGTLCLETSATCITPKGYLELAKLGCEWAKKMYKLLTEKTAKIREAKRTRPVQDDNEELMDRRKMGKGMFMNKKFREAFNLDS